MRGDAVVGLLVEGRVFAVAVGRVSMGHWRHPRDHLHIFSHCMLSSSLAGFLLGWRGYLLCCKQYQVFISCSPCSSKSEPHTTNFPTCAKMG